MDNKISSEELRIPEPEQLAIDRKFVLEIIFVAIVSFVTLAAFTQALSYHIISSRTPFVIMVPMIVLLALHINKLRKSIGPKGIKHLFGSVLANMPAEVKTTLYLLGWLCVMGAGIIIGGHYVGVTMFMFLMIYYVAKEPFKLTIITTLGTTSLIYGIFEYGFNIELYRGMIFRYFAGYDIY